MTTGFKTFLSESESVTEIIQKFCCPGHSSIQEVDNIHCTIEKTLKYAESSFSDKSIEVCAKEVSV